MSANIRPAVTTTVVATIVGVVGGSVVATAMGHDTRQDFHRYLTFVAFLGLVALAAVGAWAYQTYMKPEPAHVEETEADTAP